METTATSKAHYFFVAMFLLFDFTSWPNQMFARVTCKRGKKLVTLVTLFAFAMFFSFSSFACSMCTGQCSLLDVGCCDHSRCHQIRPLLREIAICNSPFKCICEAVSMQIDFYSVSSLTDVHSFEHSSDRTHKFILSWPMDIQAITRSRIGKQTKWTKDISTTTVHK